MMITSGIMRNMPEATETTDTIKVKDEDTTQLQTCENKVEIHKSGTSSTYSDNDIHTVSHLMLSLASMLTPMLGVQEAKELQHCYHDLDKRISVLEALMNHSK